MNLPRTLAKLVPQITYSFKAFPGHGQSLEVLAHQLSQAGNTVLEINQDGGYVLCRQFTENSDVWGCMLCLHNETIVLVDSEQELRDHLDVTHEGWQIDDHGVPIVTP